MITSGFYNSLNGDRKYNAEQFSDIFTGVIRDGVFKGVENEFNVTPNGDNSVSVDTGRGWFNGKWVKNDAPVVLSCDEADATHDRIDVVVIEFSKTGRKAALKILKGEGGVSPSAPLCISNDDAVQYPIANIRRAAGSKDTSSITKIVGTNECPYVQWHMDEVQQQAYKDMMDGYAETAVSKYLEEHDTGIASKKDISDVIQALSEESSDRTAGDSEIDEKLDAEISKRDAQYSEITEAIEGTASSEDISELRGLIDTETSTRVSKDSEIDEKLDAEISKRDAQYSDVSKLKEDFDDLKSNLSEDNAYSHNGIYRGKDITADYDSGEFSTNVKNGTFKNIFIGDYITKSINVDDKTYAGKWIVADLDYFYNKGDTACTTHHVVLIPDFNIGLAKMNDTNTTVGGYVGSKMYTETLPKYLSAIQTAFGSSHIVKHRSLFSNGINASGYNRFGSNSGCSNGWGWHDSYIELMSEVMVYGSVVWSSSAYDTGTSNNQLAIFRLNTSQNNFSRKGFWLKDVVSSSHFCYMSDGGNAYYNSASNASYVRPLILLS